MKFANSSTHSHKKQRCLSHLPFENPHTSAFCLFLKYISRCPIKSFFLLYMFYLSNYGKQHLCVYIKQFEKLLNGWFLFICLQFSAKLICLHFFIRNTFLIWTIGLGFYWDVMFHPFLFSFFFDFSSVGFLLLSWTSTTIKYCIEKVVTRLKYRNT